MMEKKGGDTSTILEELSVTELKARLWSKIFPVIGRKKELSARLTAAFEQ